VGKVDLLAGYRYALVFAPKDKDYIVLEPMTAPTLRVGVPRCPSHSIMLSFATSRRVVKRSHPGPHL
jgi:hypothetical protein